MGLEGRLGLLYGGHGQVLGRTKTQVVTVIVDVPMRAPGPVGHSLDLMMSGEAPVSTHKAKRGLRRQPGKPGRRLGFQREQTLLRTDHHVMPSAAPLDEG